MSDGKAEYLEHRNREFAESLGKLQESIKNNEVDLLIVLGVGGNASEDQDVHQLSIAVGTTAEPYGTLMVGLLERSKIKLLKALERGESKDSLLNGILEEVLKKHLKH